MRLGRILIIVAVLLIVLLLLVFSLSSRGGGGLTEADIAATQAASEIVTVVILQQPVARGEVIPIEKLGIVELPRNAVSDAMISDVVDAAQKIARYDLQQGTYLTSNMVLEDFASLATSGVGSEHATLIPEGMVAVSIPINRFSSMAYGLTRGDRVNLITTFTMVDLDFDFQTILPNFSAGVFEPGNNIIITAGNELAQPGQQEGGGSDTQIIVSDFSRNIVAQSGTGGITSPIGRVELESLLDQPFYQVPQESQRPRLVSQTVLQNVVVLQVGNFKLVDETGQEVEVAVPTPTSQNQGGQQQAPPGEEIVETPDQVEPPDIITLIVWPQDAVMLNYLVYSGAEMTLALRSAGDGTQTLTDAVTLQYLLQVYNIPVPAKLPYGMDQRVDDVESPVLENDEVINPFEQ